ncbi:hypothetical protein SH2C18_01670 [Clostridium sediminicola]|uniref:glycosyltransferase n=1 Tax=Clostridium sediminicola TaxID=3114879 RepID=UPI0031F1D393
MKLLFVAQNLQMGGIQKALVNTIKELHKEKKYDIEVFLFGDGVLLKDIPENISVYRGSLLLRLVSTPFSVIKGEKNIFYLFIRIICMIFVRIIGSDKFYSYLLKKQKIFNKYDVAISYFNDVQNGYFNRGTNQFVDECVDARKKIAWIHTDPIKAGFDYSTSLNLYRNFDSIVCVSNACREKFIKLLPEFKNKTSVVYNFFPLEEIKAKATEYNPFQYKGISLISVGRIDNATKRFHLIPQICKMLKNASITGFKWRIVGDGPDLKYNKKLVKTLDVSELVEFVGEKANPYPYVKKSDLFVLTSAYEGFPMVIGEALILGTPVVTTCFAAVNEQIIKNYNGLITEMRLDNIYSAIKYLLEEPIKIEKMKDNIRNDSLSNMIAIKQFRRRVGIAYEQ